MNITGFMDAMQSISNVAKNVVVTISKYANSMYLSLLLSKSKDSADPRKRKAYVIYYRTKSKRIKNKQIKIMEGY